MIRAYTVCRNTPINPHDSWWIVLIIFSGLFVFFGARLSIACWLDKRQLRRRRERLARRGLRPPDRRQ